MMIHHCAPLPPMALHYTGKHSSSRISTEVKSFVTGCASRDFIINGTPSYTTCCRTEIDHQLIVGDRNQDIPSTAGPAR